MLARVTALGTLFFMQGCARSTQCRVENLSSSPLTHIVVSGTGFSAPVSDLAPGASASVALHPTDEAGEIAVVFEAGGREHRHSEHTYFEARSYSLLVRVNPTFEVSVRVSLASVVRTSSSSAPLEGAG